LQRTGGAKPNVIQAAAVALFVLGACCAPAGPDKDADPAGVLPISVAAEPTSELDFVRLSGQVQVQKMLLFAMCVSA